MPRAKYLRSPAGSNSQIANVVPIRGQCPECGSEMFQSRCLRCVDLLGLKRTQIAKFDFIVRQNPFASRQGRLCEKFADQKSFGKMRSFLLDLFVELEDETEEYRQLLILIELFDDRESLPYTELVRQLS